MKRLYNSLGIIFIPIISILLMLLLSASETELVRNQDWLFAFYHLIFPVVVYLISIFLLIKIWNDGNLPRAIYIVSIVITFILWLNASEIILFFIPGRFLVPYPLWFGKMFIPSLDGMVLSYFAINVSEFFVKGFYKKKR